jgi:ketosteroid isomerase-like protein
VYRAIVARKIRRNWAAVARQDATPVMEALAPEFEYHFIGDHALGGVRHTADRQREWFERLFRLFPDIRFDVKDVVVTGMPWRTRAVVVAEATLDSDPSYHNYLAQALELRWGRLTKVRMHEDSQLVARHLERHPLEEARSAPIVG